MTDPWHAWSELAGGEWGHAIELPGSSDRAEIQYLEEPEPGVYRWVEERLHRTFTGLWIFVLRSRTLEGPEQVRVLCGSNPDEIVVAVRGQVGMPPVRLELFGKAGMEIGLEPDNDIEGDELGPLPEEPTGEAGEETSEITLERPFVRPGEEG